MNKLVKYQKRSGIFIVLEKKSMLEKESEKSFVKTLQKEKKYSKMT